VFGANVSALVRTCTRFSEVGLISGCWLARRSVVSTVSTAALQRGKVSRGLGEQIGTLLGPERTRECLSVIGLLPRMDHLAMFRPAPAVVRGILIVL
jgi:hypothetical protein